MLFTDVSYKESTRFEDVQSMKTVIEKLKKIKLSYQQLYLPVMSHCIGICILKQAVFTQI